jgi:hypothetical protein
VIVGKVVYRAWILAACSLAAESVSVTEDESDGVSTGSSTVAAAMRAATTARAASVARRRAEERASASAVSLRIRAVRASRCEVVTIFDDGADGVEIDAEGPVRVLVRVASWDERWLRAGSIG